MTCCFNMVIARSILITRRIILRNRWGVIIQAGQPRAHPHPPGHVHGDSWPIRQRPGTRQQWCLDDLGRRWIRSSLLERCSSSFHLRYTSLGLLGNWQNHTGWLSGLERRPATGRSMVRVPLQKTFRFATLAIPFTPLCQCLSEETVKAVGPFYLVSMPACQGK